MAARFLTTSGTSGVALATASAGVLYSALYTTTGCEERAEKDKNFRIEVHLMDKIQQKSYLETAKEGIPSTLRIMAIDLPTLRKDAFVGECRLAHDKIFVDDVAPPKAIQVETRDEAKKAKDGKKPSTEKLRIAQKALVKSLVQCRSAQSQQKAGVEIMEASVAGLNRFRLRKTHEVGSFKYDPGKYFVENNKDRRKDMDEEIEEADPAELLDFSSYEDELEAPWNQYSWIEEMRLRISGQVPFGAPLERSNRFQRVFLGSAFLSTVPTVSRFWEWPLPKFAKSDPDGLDGRNQTVCRASSKPHAVIANGAALQRVPSSLRLLQKACRKANVPLFVIDDPRVWGGNTHSSLGEALKDMRSTIKNRVIAQALKQHGSSAFTRGRLLGQAETEARWYAKNKAQKAKDLLSGEGRRRRRRAAEQQRDWSRLDANLLEKKLVERGVITKKKAENENQRTYSAAMVEISRRCVDEVSEEGKENEGEKRKESTEA
ncbi:unnamed protein product [Cylindrotheca closterium]|uniref:Uncharacterized protein n=1 Tax=Cylindrotheca closterium TaxID=2856 RepID=A0AAD2G4Y7_9STRA|nr:unnamed protein product [Cylindrotheca closterium]